MPRRFHGLLALLLVVSGVQKTAAFSLSGIPDAWQVQAIGYQIDAPDIFAPMNLGEEYRWNTPNITYGFDPSFLDYFGARGVEAVEEAVQILNSLPPVSAMSADLSEFPLDTRRFNHQATALGIFDVKTWSLSLMLVELGLTAPERWVFTLRSRVVLPGPTPVYTTVKRNFDPITLVPSSYINGTLYTYQILQTFANPDTWEAVDFVIDPLAPTHTTVASIAGVGIGTDDFRGFFNNVSGLFVTGLTRDDAGAIRYIYSKNNANTENLPPNATVVSGGGGPWGVPGGGTNAGGGVLQGLRRGVDKVNLIRVNFDSFLGQFVPITNRYEDVIITNGVTRSQTVERLVTQPDILFGVADLGVSTGGIPIFLGRNRPFINNDAINGQVGLAGPGEIQSQAVIVFSNAGPWFFNVLEGSEETATPGFVWGHYDGTTNAPVVFPVGTSIRDIEQLVFGASGGTPWAVP